MLENIECSENMMNIICSENIDGNEMIYNKVLNSYKNVCNSCTICIVCLSLLFY